MPNDLFAQNNIDPTQNAPVDLFAQQGINPNQPGFWQNLESGINVGGAKFGGNLIQDIGSLGQGFKQNLNTANLLPQGLMSGQGAQQAQNLGANISNNAPQMYGQPQGLTGALAQGFSQYAPYLIGGELAPTSGALSSIPYAGRLMSPLAQKAAQAGAAYGASQSAPGQAVSGAASDAALNFGLGNVGAAVGGAKNALGLVTGKTLQDSSNTVAQAMSGGLGKQDLNAVNNANLRTNYALAKGKNSAGFTAFDNATQARGYATTGAPPTSNAMGPNLYESIQGLGSNAQPSKFISPSYSTQQGLQNLLNIKPNQVGTPNISSELQGQINSYLQSPTYQNAHSLQSMLGQEATSMRSGLTATSVDKQMANTINGVRSGLKTDIGNNFDANGDPDLGAQYKQLGVNFKNTVAPYHNVPSIYRMINGGDDINNISNVIARTGRGQNYNVIRNDLMTSPTQSRQVLAQALSGAMKQDANGNIIANPNKLIDLHNNLPENLQGFSQSSNFDGAMQGLKSTQALMGKWQPAAKFVGKKIGEGALLGAGLSLFPGAEHLKELL